MTAANEKLLKLLPPHTGKILKSDAEEINLADLLSAVFNAGAARVRASFRSLEHVDISSVDHVVTIGDGVADGIYCDTTGEILKIDTATMTGFTTLALQAGYNPIEVTKIYKIGSTIAGNVDVGSFE